MTTPKRLPPDNNERLRVIADGIAGGSARGSTRWARQVQRTTPTLRSSGGNIVVIEHGDDGTVERPDGAIVMWVGAATPASAEVYDFWYPVTL